MSHRLQHRCSSCTAVRQRTGTQDSAHQSRDLHRKGIPCLVNLNGISAFVLNTYGSFRCSNPFSVLVTKLHLHVRRFPQSHGTSSSFPPTPKPRLPWTSPTPDGCRHHLVRVLTCVLILHWKHQHLQICIGDILVKWSRDSVRPRSLKRATESMLEAVH